MRREARKHVKLKSLTTLAERIQQKYEDQLNHDELRVNKGLNHSYLLAVSTPPFSGSFFNQTIICCAFDLCVILICWGNPEDYVLYVFL